MNNYRPSDLIVEHVSVIRHPSRPGDHQSDEFRREKILERLQGRPSLDQLIGLAKALSLSRWRRKDFLSADLFGEPGWDILLALFHAEGKGQRLTVSDLCVASDSPQTTALRSLDRLRQLDLVERGRSATDGRIVYVFLKPTAHQKIEEYLRKIWDILFDGR